MLQLIIYLNLNIFLHNCKDLIFFLLQEISIAFYAFPKLASGWYLHHPISDKWVFVGLLPSIWLVVNYLFSAIQVYCWAVKGKLNGPVFKNGKSSSYWGIELSNYRQCWSILSLLDTCLQMLTGQNVRGLDLRLWHTTYYETIFYFSMFSILKCYPWSMFVNFCDDLLFITWTVVVYTLSALTYKESSVQLNN